MGTYNTATCTLQCPRCLHTVAAQVDIYLGNTTRMLDVQVGETYPFHDGREPQSGGPVEGVLEDAGYTECPVCGRDFFCSVEIRDRRLIAIAPSRTIPPYKPDRVAEGPAACPRCGSRETRHLEFDNLAIGSFLCDLCHFRAVSTLDQEGRRYRTPGVEIRRLAPESGGQVPD